MKRIISSVIAAAIIFAGGTSDANAATITYDCRKYVIAPSSSKLATIYVHSTLYSYISGQSTLVTRTLTKVRYYSNFNADLFKLSTAYYMNNGAVSAYTLRLTKGGGSASNDVSTNFITTMNTDVNSDMHDKVLIIEAGVSKYTTIMGRC